MRKLLRFSWAAAIGMALGSAASAQTNGSTGGSSGGSTSGGGGNTASQDVIQFATPSSLDQSLGNQIGASSLNQSNILGRYYANPYYQGRAGAATGEIPGGFGSPLFGTSTAGGGGGAYGSTGSRTTSNSSASRTSSSFGGSSTSSGFAGTNSGFGSSMGLGATTTGFNSGSSRSGFGGTTTGFGGTSGIGGRGGIGGIGGIGGTGNLGGRMGMGGTTNSAQVVPMSRQINYTATLQIPRQPVQAVASRMQTDLRAMIDRSTQIANPQGVQIATDGAVVLLRGNARDEDEARLIEGMVRLTPGVRDVRNELKFPEPPPQQP